MTIGPCRGYGVGSPLVGALEWAIKRPAPEACRKHETPEELVMGSSRSHWRVEVDNENYQVYLLEDGGFSLGFLNDYPDYQTQGLTKRELFKNLRSLLVDIESGEMP